MLEAKCNMMGAGGYLNTRGRCFQSVVSISVLRPRRPAPGCVWSPRGAPLLSRVSRQALWYALKSFGKAVPFRPSSKYGCIGRCRGILYLSKLVLVFCVSQFLLHAPLPPSQFVLCVLLSRPCVLGVVHHRVPLGFHTLLRLWCHSSVYA